MHDSWIMGESSIQQYRVSKKGQCLLYSSFVECAIMTGLSIKLYMCACVLRNTYKSIRKDFEKIIEVLI